MRKLIATLLTLALAATVGVQAQLLWRVTATGDAAAKPSYLFGTYHLMPGTFIDSVAGLGDALSQVETIYVEIESDSIGSPAAQQLMLQAMLAPADSALSTLVSAEGYKIISGVVQKYFRPLGVDMSAFEKLTPAGIAAQLQVMQAMPLMSDLDMTNLLDAAMERRAREKGAQARSLETVALQVQLLFGDPLTVQAADLLELCKHDDVIGQKMTELAAAYRGGEIDKLAAIMEDSDMGGSAEEMDRLVWGRNRRWVAELAPVMREHSVMVSVGAGHLPTVQGLIHLLREQGFTVEPVVAQ